MDLPTKAAWPVRRYVVFRCRGFSPCLYTRERVLRSLESPLPLFTYRIAYFSQKKQSAGYTNSDIRFCTYIQTFLFVLYVLTNRVVVCYNNSVVGNPAEQYRRTFFVQEISYRFFFKKPCFLPPKSAIKTKTVEKVTNIWYNVLAYPARSVKQKSNSRKEITENDQKRNR